MQNKNLRLTCRLSGQFFHHWRVVFFLARQFLSYRHRAEIIHTHAIRYSSEFNSKQNVRVWDLVDVRANEWQRTWIVSNVKSVRSLCEVRVFPERQKGIHAEQKKIYSACVARGLNAYKCLLKCFTMHKYWPAVIRLDLHRNNGQTTIWFVVVEQFSCWTSEIVLFTLNSIHLLENRESHFDEPHPHVCLCIIR